MFHIRFLLYHLKITIDEVAPYPSICKRSWQYKAIPEIVGGGKGFLINTEDEFDSALTAAFQHLEAFCLLDVRLDPNDGSDALQRLTDVLGKRVR